MSVVDDRVCRKVREVIARIRDELLVGSNVAWQELVTAASRAQLEERDIHTRWGLSVLRSRKMAVDPVADALQRRIEAKQTREQAAKRAAEIKTELEALRSKPSSDDAAICKVFALRRELLSLGGVS